jgi:hypothetical protein
MARNNPGILISMICFRYLGRQYRQHIPEINQGKNSKRPGRYLGNLKGSHVRKSKNRILSKPHRTTSTKGPVGYVAPPRPSSVFLRLEGRHWRTSKHSAHRLVAFNSRHISTTRSEIILHGRVTQEFRCLHLPSVSYRHNFTLLPRRRHFRLPQHHLPPPHRPLRHRPLRHLRRPPPRRSAWMVAQEVGSCPRH